ncbi:hypothetical protein GCM10009844_00410 [Nocardioides koreensis]|uniref:Uncharacterized protein n=1 Tax=Nocardioides koreensis TaxID=433651 RepID=A0ABP5KW44_9ACTN
MADSNLEHFRFEPTVFGAVRRHSAMVVAVVLATVAVAVGLTLAQPEAFRAQATVTVPQPLSAADQASDQYLDSQVLLLQSPDVAERAADIANRSLGRQVLTKGDFKGEGASLEIIPPAATIAGAYGANIVTVAFIWPDAEVAQEGANAVLRAFDEARADSIMTQGEATVAGIEKAIKDARTRGQLTDLLDQRTEALVTQQMDLARHPVVAWAAEPQVPVNGNVKKSGVTGLLIGTVLGAGLAFARASRRRCFDDELQPAALYDAPLLGGVPASSRSSASPGLAGVPGRLAMTDAPRSADAEAFRFTAGSVQRIRAEHGKRLSLAFVSTVADPARSAVVANLALAVAESGARVLAVDADASRGELTDLLLPDRASTDGFEQVLAGTRSLTECIEHSPLHPKVAVLPSGAPTAQTVTGAAYLSAVRQVLGKGKAGYEVVLVDSPALLEVAVATELVDACEAVVVVMGPHEPLREHLDLLGRLDLIEASPVGYIYRREPARSGLGRLQDLVSRSTGRFDRPRDWLVRAKGWLGRPSPAPEVRR